MFHNILENPDNNWYKLIMSLWSDLDPAVRMTFFENFIVNTSLIGYGRQEKAAAEHNCNIPWAILMDPTSACNMRCTGCVAGRASKLKPMNESPTRCRGTLFVRR